MEIPSSVLYKQASVGWHLVVASGELEQVATEVPLYRQHCSMICWGDSVGGTFACDTYLHHYFVWMLCLHLQSWSFSDFLVQKGTMILQLNHWFVCPYDVFKFLVQVFTSPLHSLCSETWSSGSTCCCGKLIQEFSTLEWLYFCRHCTPQHSRSWLAGWLLSRCRKMSGVSLKRHSLPGRRERVPCILYFLIVAHTVYFGTI